MISRFFNALAWISLIVTFVIFLIAYAGFPDDVLVMVDKAGNPETYLSKNLLFYTLLGFIGLMNAVLVILKGMTAQSLPEFFLTHSAISLTQLFFNVFFATSVFFVNILNSQENYDYSKFGYLIYASALLLLLAMVFTLTSRYILKK